MFDEISATDAFRRGDSAAFDWLAMRYLGKAKSAARHFMRNASDAEDLAQDAFVRAWDYREHLIAGRRFGPWLLQIVRNLAIDLLRRRSCVPHEDLRATYPTTRLDWPDTIANARLLAERIRRAMKGLPLTQRTVALLYILYRSGDPLCCPTGGGAIVRFRWNGSRLVALDRIPPTSGAIHR